MYKNRGVYVILISSNKKGHRIGDRVKGMRYAIKDFYIDTTIVHDVVYNAKERNLHINTVSEDYGIAACVYRPIYKSGEYGKRVVVTFNPLTVHHEGNIYDLFV